MSGRKHVTEGDKINGLSSPSKIQKFTFEEIPEHANTFLRLPQAQERLFSMSPPAKEIQLMLQIVDDAHFKLKDSDDRVSRMKEMLSKSGVGGRPGFIMPMPKPKPKPKPKPVAEINGRSFARKDSSSLSPDHPDPFPILLNTDSLRDFSEVLNYDFDAVTRHQILDNSAQRDRAALSQCKGLQNRRLPKNLINKVPDNYSASRQTQTYSGSSAMKRSSTQPLSTSSWEEIDGGEIGGVSLVVSQEITEDERRQRNLAKLGVQQSSSPLSALGSILKRNSGSRSSLPKKDSARPPTKTKTKNSLVSPAAETRLGSEPPQSLSPNVGGLFRSLRRSNSNANANPKTKKKKKRNKNGDFDDTLSETSSIVSLPIHYALDEKYEPTVTKPTTPPMRSVALPSTASLPPSTASHNTSSRNEDRKKSPPATSSPQKVLLREGGTSSASTSKRKTTDSAIFKDDSFETLFGSASLFDSGELDKLLGKKEEKALEIKSEDKAPAKKSSESSEEKKKVSSPNNSVPKSSVKSPNSYGSSLTKTDRKRTSDCSRLNIKSQLHRYESNSKAKKDDSPFTSLTSTVGNDSPKLEDIGGDASTSKSTSEKKNMPLLFEDEEDNLFGKPSTTTNKKEDMKKSAEIGDSSAAKSTMAAAGSSSAKEKKTPEDEEDILFGKPSTTIKKDENNKVKKESLFDDDVFGDELPSSATKISTAESTDESKEKTDAKSEKKKRLHDIFGDPLDLVDGGNVNSESKKEEQRKKKSTSDIFGDPLDLDSGVSTRSKDKKEDKQTVFGEPMFSGISPSDTATTEENKKKKSSIFDEVEDDDSSLFTSKFRSRRSFGRRSPTAEDDDSLFDNKISRSRKSTQEVDDVSVTDSVVFDSLADKKIESGSPEKVVVKDEEKEDAPSKETIVASDKKNGDELLSSDTAEEKTTSNKEKEPTEKPAIKAKPAPPPKVSRKPRSSLSSTSKEDSSKPNEDGRKPSWITDLKKRKQSSEATGPAAAEQKQVKDVPEWKKRALEREKNKELGKAGVSPKVGSSRNAKRNPDSLSGNESPSSDGKSPKTSRKSRPEDRSPKKDATDGTANCAEETDGKLSTESSGPKSPTRYKTRREREREAKAQEEKETEQEKTQIKEVKSTYKTRREREREAKEKGNSKLEEPEEKSSYLTRRQREREAAKKLEGDEGMEGEVDATEVRSRYKSDSSVKETDETLSPASTERNESSSPTRYKTRREREREANEQGKEKETELASDEVKSTYKTRREREREAKEADSGKQEETKEKSSYLTRRQEREAAKKLEGDEGMEGEVDATEVRSRYKSDSSVKETDETLSPASTERNESSSPTRYKTRREREREAKEQGKETELASTQIDEVKSTYKTRREKREREAKEADSGKRGETKEKSSYLTRRQEREAAKKLEEKVGKKSEVDAAEVRPRYKTRREREREARELEEKENKKEADDGDVKSSYKTRQEREMEEKEQEEKEAKKETDTYESEYKSRRQREREEQEKTSNGTSLNETRTSPSRPMPDDKSNSEASGSTSRSSYADVDEDKLSATKHSPISERGSDSDKKQQNEVEDDVFGLSSTEGRKSPAIDLESPAIKSEDIDDTKHISANGKTDVTSDDGGKPIPSKSPLTLSGSSSTKSSLSSERDLNESSKSHRSHSQSRAISRSPSPNAVPTKSVPEWKKKIAEKKKTVGSSAMGKTAPMKGEKDDKLPPWKKELLAKKKTKGDGKEEGPRSAREGAGVLTKTSTAAGRRSKEPAPTPDFMKEFKKKKRAVNS